MDSEALNAMETKVIELERRVYGQKDFPTENFNPIIDSLLITNTLMMSAVNGRERILSVIQRLKELNQLLAADLPSSTSKVESQLEVINYLCEKHPEQIVHLQALKDLDKLLGGKYFREIDELKSDLIKVQLELRVKRDKLNDVTDEVEQLISQFNGICLEISKIFVALNESITQLETKKIRRETIEID